MLPYPLINFDIKKISEDLMEFIPEIIYLIKQRMGAYVMKFDEYFDIGTHWIALHALNNNVTYLERFGVERN